MYIIGFGEIFTKGNNKSFFELVLIRNIKNALNLKPEEFIKFQNRYLINKDNVENLKYVFGLAFYSKVISTDFDNMKTVALSLVKKEKTFRISTKRLTKEYKPSQEINAEIADYILRHDKNIKVNLDNPELEIKIEILNGKAYIYSNKSYQRGLQGLPVGTAGDIYLDYKQKETGTVAGYLLMKRGCNLILPKPIKILDKFNIDSNIKSCIPQAPQQSEDAYGLARSAEDKSLSTHSKRMSTIFIASDKSLNEITKSNKLKSKSETIFYPLISFNKKEIKQLYKKIIRL